MCTIFCRAYAAIPAAVESFSENENNYRTACKPRGIIAARDIRSEGFALDFGREVD